MSFGENTLAIYRPASVDLSRKDWETRIRGGQSLIPDNARGINPAEYERSVGIYNRLRLPDVVGRPALLEASGEWFREITGTFLSAVDTTGNRLIRELFVLAPKKSSKTSYGAAMMVTALLLNDRPRAEFLLIGPTKLVADLAFTQATGMIEADETGFLQKVMHVQENLKTITNRRTKAKLMIKTFDTKVLVGVKPVGVLIDELHEISKNSRAGKIIGQIRGGILPYPEGFLAFITTQSDDPPAGAFKSELSTARKTRDAKIAISTMMPILYEFPRDIIMDKTIPPAWQNPANWAMVTPNNNRSVTISRLVEDFETAREKGPDELRRWASQHLNIEIGLALGNESWPGAEYWEACADPTLLLANNPNIVAHGGDQIDVFIARCDLIVCGVDGGGLDDLLGFSMLGRDAETGDWLHYGKGWAHKSVFERRKEIAERLMDFVNDGDLVIVEDIGDDIEQLADIVDRLEKAGKLPWEKFAVGVDQAGIVEIVSALINRGIDQERIGGVAQGWQLQNTIKAVERRLAGTRKGKRFRHCAQGIMAWCVGNAKREANGSITKAAAGFAKIDLLMALFDSAAALSRNPEPQGSYTATESVMMF